MTLVLFILMSMFLLADQRIMSAILPELQQEYGVQESILGWVGSAFILVGSFVSIFFGYFADIFSRKKLLIITVAIGEIPCFLTGIEMFTPDFESLVILRILTGIGLGGIFPLTFSLISDYFREEYRAIATGWLSVAWAIGMLVGPGIAGYLTASYGWRLAFILVAIPNFPLILIFALMAGDPPKGQTEKALSGLISKGARYGKTIKFNDFGTIFANKTNLLIFAQGIFGTVPWGILGYWAILFFERQRDLPKEDATTLYLAMGVGITIGAVFWAYVGTALYRRNPRYTLLLCSAGVFIGIIPTTFVYNLAAIDNWLPAFALFSALGGFCIAVPAGNIKAILMNVNRPEHRGSVFAVFNITDHLGQGFGPAIGGILLPLGFLFTINFAILMWVPCGLLLLAAAFTVEQDRNSLHDFLEQEAQIMRKRVKNETML